MSTLAGHFEIIGREEESWEEQQRREEENWGAYEQKGHCGKTSALHPSLQPSLQPPAQCYHLVIYDPRVIRQLWQFNQINRRFWESANGKWSLLIWAISQQTLIVVTLPWETCKMMEEKDGLKTGRELQMSINLVLSWIFMTPGF